MDPSADDTVVAPLPPLSAAEEIGGRLDPNVDDTTTVAPLPPTSPAERIGGHCRRCAGKVKEAIEAAASSLFAHRRAERKKSRGSTRRWQSSGGCTLTPLCTGEKGGDPQGAAGSRRRCTRTTWRS